jgi:hypothetical protein
LIGLGLCSGCYQSNAIKQEAINLDSEVESFKAQKQSQIQAINQTFQDTSDKLMDQLTALCDVEMDLSRDLDAQSIADQAVIDPNKVLLPGLMHDQTVNFISAQWAKIAAVDSQLTQTRKTYANSYKSMNVTLTQLDTIHSGLQKLINESNSPDAQTILQYLQSGYDGARTGISNSKSDLAKTGSAPPAPAVPH